MELIALAFAWPFVIFAIGLVFISLDNISLFFVWPAFLLLIILFAAKTKLLGFSSEEQEGKSDIEKLDQMRKVAIIFSVAVLLPLFARYLIDAFSKNLAVIIAGLALGFGFAVWGMFVKNNRALMVSNVVGGALILFYVYTQLWDLGELARIVAAGFGLLVAVVISVIKLRDKLS